MSAKTYSGINLDEALSAACRDLNSRVGELRYEVTAERAGGVEVAADVDQVAVLGLFFSEMFRAGGLDLRVQLEEGPEVLRGNIEGRDSTILTGNGGQALDALQYLSNRILDRRLREHPPVRLDVSGFKQRREVELQERAREAADQVAENGRLVMLQAMAPAARRLVHLALAEDPRVETESQGNGFLKRVIIRPPKRR